MPEYVPDGQVLDLTGQTFGTLTVLRRHGTHRKYATWWCRCSCGAECEARGDRLRKGRKRYCGASVHRRVPRYSAGRNLAWRSWNRMLQRCHNPKHQAFAKYGGEGIKVCARWRKSFDAFFADMGERPSRAHSIDRRDNEKGYFKANCRWATVEEQQINRRCTLYVEWQGERVRLKALCDQLGLRYTYVMTRIRSLGWPVERAVSEPCGRRGRRKKDATPA